MGLALTLAFAAAPAQLRPRPSALRPDKALRPQIPPVLRRAIQAAPTLRFSGRRVVTRLRDGRSERHEEIVVRDGPRGRIEYAPGDPYAGQVIVENAAERRHFVPSEGEVRVQPPLREEGLQRLRALARTARLTAERGDRIAGVATVEVVARDSSGNPLQRLAIDPASGLVLRRRVYDATGLEIGGFVYTKVDLSPAPFDPGLFRIERKGVRTVTPWDVLRRLAKRGGYRAVGLPESTGFRLDGVRVAPAGPFLVQSYVGPGGRLFLYQLRAAVDPARLRRQARRLQSLSWTEGDLTFVLLGPQDEATLSKLREALGR